jgi:hypothetical protein
MRLFSALLASVGFYFSATFCSASIYVALNEANAASAVPDEIVNVTFGGAGSTFQNIGTGQSPQGVAVTPDNSTVYWSNFTSNALTSGIYRRSVSGGPVLTTVLTGANSIVSGIAIDPTGGKLYWTNTLTGSKGIWQSNLDGSSAVRLIDTTNAMQHASFASNSLPGYLTLDVPANKIYWTDSVLDAVYSSPLSGVGPSILISSSAAPTPAANPAPRGIATLAGKIYWVDSSSDKLYRVDADGNNATTILDLLTVQSSSSSNGLAIGNGQLLWTDSSGTEGVYRSTLNGGQIGGSWLLYGSAASGIPLGIAAVPDPSSLHLLTLASGLGGVLMWWKRR